MKDFFLFSSWFALNILTEAAMDFGAYIIGMVKTNAKLLCKDTINNLKKCGKGGYYLVLKRNYMVPSYRLLISVGLKYNYHKVLYFAVTEDSESTKSGIHYFLSALNSWIMFPFYLFIFPVHVIMLNIQIGCSP